MHNVQPRPFFTLQNWLLTASLGELIKEIVFPQLNSHGLSTAKRVADYSKKGEK